MTNHDRFLAGYGSFFGIRRGSERDKNSKPHRGGYALALQHHKAARSLANGLYPKTGKGE